MADKKDAVTNEEAVSNDENNDQVVEEESENAESSPEQEPEEELTEEEKLSRRVAELEDKLLRAAAEFENFKKRMARNYENMTRMASERILLDLLEVADSFERALEHMDKKTDLKAFREGTELIFGQMTTLLDKYEVTPIVALGEKFDPNLHEAMMQVPSEDYEEGLVAIEMSKGYRLGQHVLRHAKVGVSMGVVDEKKKDEK
ncbi:MAG: nucleotide exchange factor GrpE [candidate division Zixibacteria bacterium]|nr:nucleotide exchange factor GrpE [candidate division Zixibacteria bacterium]